MRIIESDFAKSHQISPRCPRDEPIYVIAVSQETAHGGTEETWQAMLAGEPLVTKTMDSANDLLLRNSRTRYLSPLQSDPYSRLHPNERRDTKLLSRNAAFNIVHSRQLLAQVGLLDGNGQFLNQELLEPHLVAVMIASGYGPTGASIDVYDLLKTKGPDTITPSLAGKEFPEQPNSRTIAALQMPGAFPLTLAAACASGSQSIAMAVDKLKEGYQLAIAGGVETVADEHPAAYAAGFPHISSSACPKSS